MSINLQAKSVRVILTKGMDVILIDLDMPTTFPTMDYVSSIEIKTEYDCGSNGAVRISMSMRKSLTLVLA
jgi:hypothetical protein